MTRREEPQQPQPIEPPRPQPRPGDPFPAPWPSGPRVIPSAAEIDRAMADAAATWPALTLVDLDLADDPVAHALVWLGEDERSRTEALVALAGCPVRLTDRERAEVLAYYPAPVALGRAA